MLDAISVMLKSSEVEELETEASSISLALLRAWDKERSSSQQQHWHDDQRASVLSAANTYSVDCGTHTRFPSELP